MQAPVDHTRILLQVKRTTNTEKYTGSFNAGYEIMKKYGVRGLYLGFNATLLRETIAIGWYFTVYEEMMRILTFDGETQNRDLVNAFFSGGVAGCTSWIVTYPIDYIKTVYQSQSLSRRQYYSAFECFQKKFAEEGFRTFFKGMGITILRSFPVNGVGFFAFEGSRKLFKGHV